MTNYDDGRTGWNLTFFFTRRPVVFCRFYNSRLFTKLSMAKENLTKRQNWHHWIATEKCYRLIWKTKKAQNRLTLFFLCTAEMRFKLFCIILKAVLPWVPMRLTHYFSSLVHQNLIILRQSSSTDLCGKVLYMWLKTVSTVVPILKKGARYLWSFKPQASQLNFCTV